MIADEDAEEFAVPDGWNVQTLSELADDERGITYGIVQPGHHVSGGVPIVRVQNIVDGTLDTSDMMLVALEIAAKYRRTCLRGGELLLSLVGSVGSSVIAPAEIAGWNTARAVAVVPLRDGIDARFVRFCLRSSPLQHLMEVWCNTTVQATLNLKDVCRLPIPLPPPREREAIVETLAALDAKIELNRQMNRALEDLAGVLFRAWFVDFEPVVAKVALRAPFGLAPAVAAHFPATFTDSELGPIPLGWRSGKVSELASMSRGGISPGDFPTEAFDHYSIPAFDDRRQPQPELGSTIKSNKFPVPAECVLVSKLNPRMPRVWMPELTGERRAICSTEFLVMTPKQPITREFLCCLFSSDAFTNEFATFVTGTSGSHQRVMPESLLGMDVVIPPAPLVKRFTEIVRPWLAQIAHNIRESNTLSALRDTLLPKLLSGVLRLKGFAESEDKIPALAAAK